jgi:hypothetical protein
MSRALPSAQHSGSTLTCTAYTPARPALATGPGGAGVEAPAMAGQQVCVIVGQTQPVRPPPHLARSAARLTLLVPGDPLAASMPGYLVTQLEAAPASKSGPAAPELPTATAQATWKP